MVVTRDPSSPDPSSPASTPAGLTGFRYLLAIVVLVVLATGPMTLAVTAGLTSVTSPQSPEPQPFLNYHYPADHELRVMTSPDLGPEPHDRGGVAYR